jgi:hypothetical protein
LGIHNQHAAIRFVTVSWLKPRGEKSRERASLFSPQLQIMNQVLVRRATET